MSLRTVWQQVRSAFVREHRGVKSFEHEVAAAGGVVGRRDAGYKTIDARKVVGSVGRWQNLRSDFFYKTGRAMTQRFVSIGKAMEQGKILPPLELYKVKRPAQRDGGAAGQRSEYYVVDGHHRVAMAKKLSQDYLDAHVVEYQVAPPGPGEAAAPSAGRSEPRV